MRHLTDVDENLAAVAIFALVFALVSLDLVADAGSGTAWPHLVIELLTTAAAGVGVVAFARRALAMRAEAASWRARAEELLAGVGQSIEDQFVAWDLTAAEREVAVLLLKGLSFKEIASVRATSERTSRDQARVVYRKAGVAGRAELSAWFLEDLLPPSTVRPPGPQAVRSPPPERMAP